MLNLDTHVVIKTLEGDLSNTERELVVSSDLSVSCIVLWELAKLYQLSRITLDPSGFEVQAFLRRAIVWPIDLSIAVASTKLDFKSDPADEIIAATSIVHRIPLLTRDARIRSSSLVPLAN